MKPSLSAARVQGGELAEDCCLHTVPWQQVDERKRLKVHVCVCVCESGFWSKTGTSRQTVNISQKQGELAVKFLSSMKVGLVWSTC